MGVRGPNYMRPHSHNPFITLGEQNNPGLRQAPEIVENGEIENQELFQLHRILRFHLWGGKL